MALIEKYTTDAKETGKILVTQDTFALIDTMSILIDDLRALRHTLRQVR